MAARAGVIGIAVAVTLGAGTATGNAVPELPAQPIPAGTPIAPAIDCRPDGARPNPVVVLPGADGTTAQTASQWEPMVTALRERGACVLVFQGGVVDGQRWAGDMPSSARQVADFVAEVRRVTGADKVDIVAHSAGGFVTNYFLKVLGGAADVRSVVLIAPETRGVDGVGFLARYGVTDLPMTPVQLVQEVPFLRALLTRLMPDMGGFLQILPGSEVYRAVMDGPIAQPGVRYAVIATSNDALATPVGECSFIPEPGVVNVFYEDLFPASPVVDHSTVRSSPDTVNWVLAQLYS